MSSTSLGSVFVRILLCAGVATAVLASPAWSQSPGVITGRVIDQTGGVLPGVTVDLVTVRGTTSTVSDGAGRYRFDGVAPEAAELTFRLINFGLARRTVTVPAGATVTVDVQLALALNADVVVTGTSTFRNVADVEAPAENLVGIASAASQGAITAVQLEARPVMRVGEVLETVPGMVVSQHSGEGKANQYYLRGFNLDHGTDFSMTVAGVPVNTPTGAHAHGYADVGFLIPELVSGVQFKKGPYFADEGDFSAAGAANVNYANVLDAPMVRLTGGRFGWGRVLAAASPRLAGGHLLAALELNHSDGPWERPDNYQKTNAVLRYSRGDARNGLMLTGTAYGADWDSTDQVPVRAVERGLISRFGLVDPSDRGRARRATFAVDAQRTQGLSAWRVNAFALRNELNLFSNFTYFLDDPEHGDQFEQAERRTAAGGRVTYRRLGQLGGRHTESAVGTQFRFDRLAPVGLYHTARRQRLSTTREDRVSQTMTGVYAQTEVAWTRTLRTTLGLRGDLYAFDVASHIPVNSGTGSAGLISPKLAVAIGPWKGTEFYVNAGLGYHSNDARGAVIAVDPKTGDPADPVTPLVRARGAEVGVRTVAVRGLQSTVSVWYLGLASELLFVGDAGTTEAGRPSRRMGIEWANYWRLRPWLTADADVSFAQARFVDDDPVGHAIPGALARVISAGVTAEPRQSLFGSLRLRHFGPRSLIEDRSVRSAGTTLWNAEAGYRLSPKARLIVEVFNLFDAQVADIDYFYTSRLPGEPAEGIDDVHTHPALPRSVRIGWTYAF
ncbi:MAG: TonB-dependent receptor [Vicinamibacterales bacterium]